MPDDYFFIPVATAALRRILDGDHDFHGMLPNVNTLSREYKKPPNRSECMTINSRVNKISKYFNYRLPEIT